MNFDKLKRDLHLRGYTLTDLSVGLNISLPTLKSWLKRSETEKDLRIKIEKTLSTFMNCKISMESYYGG